MRKRGNGNFSKKGVGGKNKQKDRQISLVLGRSDAPHTPPLGIGAFITRLHLKRGGIITAPLIPEQRAALTDCTVLHDFKHTHWKCISELRRVTNDTREEKKKKLHFQTFKPRSLPSRTSLGKQCTTNAQKAISIIPACTRTLDADARMNTIASCSSSYRTENRTLIKVTASSLGRAREVPQ